MDQASLVHALQNHDELTYELVHFATLHTADIYTLPRRGAHRRRARRARPQRTLQRRGSPATSPRTTRSSPPTGSHPPRRRVIAASLDSTTSTRLTARTARPITRAHLLLAMYNALQPGVFALSGWDLGGILPLTARVAS